jgi:hypothetical protein
MKLWLDDLRDPMTFGERFTVPNRALKVLLSHGRNGWVWVKTVPEAKAILEHGNVTVLSCDNDLGSGLAEGYTLLDWLEEKAFEKAFPIPEHIYVHSDDMAQLGPMQMAIDNIKRFSKG